MIEYTPTDGETRVYIDDHDLRDASDLFDALCVTKPLWRMSRRDKWIFRGHANSEWPLLASAYRMSKHGWKNPLLPAYLAPVHPELDDSRFKQRIEHEWASLRDFFVGADLAGLQVPKDGYEFIQDILHRLKKKDESADDTVYKEWPPRSFWEAITIAQHHGVPTRFLDFTYDRLVAAFFAAQGGIGFGDVADSKICIWALNFQNLSSYVTTRYEIVNCRRTENPFLSKQAGLFVVDTDARTDVLKSVEVQSIESVISAKRDSDMERRIIPASVFFPVLVKFTLPTSECANVLAYLGRLGYDQASLKPTYDSVRETMLFKQQHGLIY
jgi:hypothetical protein